MNAAPPDPSSARVPSAGASADFDALLAPAPETERGEPARSPAANGLEAAGRAVESHAPRFEEFLSNWPLYRDPVLCAVLAGAALGALGVLVVLRRAVFVTATLSQAAGLGVALAFYLQIHHGLALSPALGALCLSVAATLLVSARPPGKMSRETLVGATFVTTSALAVLIGDRIAQEAHDIAAVLFGSAVLVRPSDLWLVSAAAALSLLGLFATARALTFTGFDPEGARVQGLPVRSLEVGFWLVFALQVSVSTRALGALPVFALSVLPAAAGLGVATRLGVAVAVAALGGALAGSAGYLAAFLGELPVGAAQASCAAAFALASLALVRRRSAPER